MSYPLFFCAIVLFLSTSLLWAEENFNCGENILVEYVSPISRNRIKSCQIKVNEVFVKDGWTYEVDATEKIINKTFYIKDQISKAPVAEKLLPEKPLETGYRSYSDVICLTYLDGRISCMKRTSKMANGFVKIDIDLNGKRIELIKSYQDICALVDHKIVQCLFPQKQDITFDRPMVKVESSGIAYCGMTADFQIECLEPDYENKKNEMKKYSVQFIPNEVNLQNFEISYADGRYFSLCVFASDHRIYCKTRKGGNSQTLTIGQMDQLPLVEVSKFQLRQNVACALARQNKFWCWSTEWNYTKNEVDTKGPIELEFNGLVKDFELGGGRLGCVILENKEVQCFNVSESIDGKKTKILESMRPKTNTLKLAVGLFMACGELNLGVLHCFENFTNENGVPIEATVNFE